LNGEWLVKFCIRKNRPLTLCIQKIHPLTLCTPKIHPLTLCYPKIHHLTLRKHKIRPLTLRHSKRPSNEIQTTIDLLFKEKGLYTKKFARAAEFPKANLSHACLMGVDFKGAQCQKANFANAQCQKANFANAQCQGANFKGAQCQGANFMFAQCQKAQLPIHARHKLLLCVLMFRLNLVNQ
jgi:hypothetical protein